MVQAIEMQSAVLKEELRLKTGEFNFAGSQKVKQDAYARRLLQDQDVLPRRLISMTEATYQGSSLRGDPDARLRRELAEAITKESNLNNELRSLRNDAHRVLWMVSDNK